MQPVKNLLSSQLKQNSQEPTESYDPKRLTYLRINFENDKQGLLEGDYDCKVCLNKGYYLKFAADTNEADLVDCKCLSFRYDRRIIEKSGLMPVLKRLTMNNFVASEDWHSTVKSKAEEYIKDYSQKWFVMLGSSGSGKTHLQSAIVGELLEKGIGSIYVTWREVVTKLKAVMNSEQYMDIMNEYKEADVLYIDDLFKNGGGQTKSLPSAADIDMAIELLDHRYKHRKSTLLSSEHLIDSILAIDEALGSRIVEMCAEKYLIQIDKVSGEKNYRLRNY